MRNQLLQSFTEVEVSDAILLRAPLVHAPVLDKLGSDRRDDLGKMAGSWLPIVLRML